MDKLTVEKELNLKLIKAKDKQKKLLLQLDKSDKKNYDLMDKVCENEKVIRSLAAKVSWAKRNYETYLNRLQNSD